jgi:hypothetical protein
LFVEMIKAVGEERSEKYRQEDECGDGAECPPDDARTE